MEEIKELRDKIDNIDDEIVRLFKCRMDIAKEIAIYKRECGLAVLNPEREKQIICRVTEDAPDDIKLYLKQLFLTLFETSKAYQGKFSDFKSKTREDIEKKISGGAKSFPVSAAVACQGVAGAFSNIASDKLFPIANNIFFKDFEGVFNAVEKGLCSFGVLPVENSLTGSVNAVYDLMQKYRFYISRAVKLPVKHCLLANSGVEMKDVKVVFSHEQALNQCSQFLKSLGNIEVTACENTAAAAKLLSSSGRTDAACISSRECADLYSLSVLKPNIQNNDSNYTRFIAISKNFEFYKGSKISIMANVAHEAGSLNKLLNRFSAMSLNLTKIESRPIPNSPFEFSFYFDFEADISDLGVLNLLSELEKTSDRFAFLGSYDEI